MYKDISLFEPISVSMLDNAYELAREIRDNKITYQDAQVKLYDNVKSIIKSMANGECRDYDQIDESITKQIVASLEEIWLKEPVNEDYFRELVFAIFPQSTPFVHWVRLLLASHEFRDFASTIGNQLVLGDTYINVITTTDDIPESDHEALLAHSEEIRADQLKRALVGVMIELGALRGTNTKYLYEITKSKDILEISDEELVLLRESLLKLNLKPVHLFPMLTAVAELLGYKE